MGIVMKKLRGKVDAARVSKVLKEKLRDVVK
jgi:Asp-tRNA(Asn)/Glu-tRNA(Gln) amidotransferase B subunit